MGEHIEVAGVDGSPARDAALRSALAHAAQTGAQVPAVRCWMPVMASKWQAAVTGEPVPPQAEQQARAGRELAQIVTAALARAPDRTTRGCPASTRDPRVGRPSAPFDAYLRIPATQPPRP